MTNARPNILFLITDQERHRGWMPPELLARLPNRKRLLDSGVEFSRHYTHSSPCSPSRATLVTGQYVPEHGVTDNVFVEPQQPDLHAATPTIGHLLGKAGYRTPYVGKWHLSYGNPNMAAYGFADWTGADWAWTGLAGTGTHFDPIIAADAATWLRKSAPESSDPWCLTVGLVNPHDVHWYPADQPGYQEAHRTEIELVNSLIGAPIPGKPGVAPWEGGEYDALFDVPANFDDTLDGKPSVHKQWRFEELQAFFGHLDHDVADPWKRMLDYYFRLHELSDIQLGVVLDALDATGAWNDTVVVWTADHGDMAGSHGLVNKGPFAYEEIMHVPLVIRAPGLAAAGTTVDALSSSVDIAPTICALAGSEEVSSMSGVSLVPLLENRAASVRDHVLFTQEQAWYQSCVAHRFALRGVFDGRYKYVRYYGCGGGVNSIGLGVPWAKHMTVPADASFWDVEHELYDLDEDPGEMENLAARPSLRADVEDHFERLRAIEAETYVHERPSGPHGGSTREAEMMAYSAAAGDDRLDG
ncbi:MAG: sulfatase-like hydrolase/transferase [Acidimicrobiales bacterium]